MSWLIRQISLARFLLFALPSVCCCCGLYGAASNLWEIHQVGFDRWWWGNNTLSIERTEQLLEIDIPEDANITEFDAYWPNYRPMTVILRFSASEQIALDFASQLCDGVLWPGYDPYNALNFREAVEGSYPITIEIHDRDVSQLHRVPFTYYSASPGVSHEVLGNRCVHEFHQFLIRVDMRGNGETQIAFDYSTYCSSPLIEDGYNTIPCYLEEVVFDQPPAERD